MTHEPASPLCQVPILKQYYSAYQLSAPTKAIPV